MKLTRLLTICILAIGFLVMASSAQNLTSQEIIDKHLAALGTKEKRDSLKTLIARGASEFEANAPLVKGGGGAILVSDAANLFFLMSFNSKEYPFEKVGYFGNRLSLPSTPMGDRSLLGKFLAEHSRILTDGFFRESCRYDGVFLTKTSGKSRSSKRAPKRSTGTKYTFWISTRLELLRQTLSCDCILTAKPFTM